MITLTEKVQVEISITPSKLADLFCQMDANEQASFFNLIADDVATWPSCNFELQMQYVTDSGVLTDGGRQIMKTIGAYSENI